MTAEVLCWIGAGLQWFGKFNRSNSIGAIFRTSGRIYAWEYSRGQCEWNVLSEPPCCSGWSSTNQWYESKIGGKNGLGSVLNKGRNCDHWILLQFPPGCRLCASRWGLAKATRRRNGRICERAVWRSDHAYLSHRLHVALDFWIGLPWQFWRRYLNGLCEEVRRYPWVDIYQIDKLLSSMMKGLRCLYLTGGWGGTLRVQRHLKTFINRIRN